MSKALGRRLTEASNAASRLCKMAVPAARLSETAEKYYSNGDYTSALLVLSELRQSRSDDPKARPPRAARGAVDPC